MKDFFEQLFAPNAQGETNAYGSNPSTLSLAGLMAATSGRRLGDVMTDAAAVNRDREMTKLKRLEYENTVNQKLAEMKFGEELMKKPDMSNPELLALMSKYGIKSNNWAGIGGLLGNDFKVIPNNITGEHDIITSRGGQFTGKQSLGDIGKGDTNGNEMPVYSNPAQQGNNPGQINTQKLPELTSNNTQQSPEKSKDRLDKFMEFSKSNAPRPVDQNLDYKTRGRLIEDNEKQMHKFRNEVQQPTLQNTRKMSNLLSTIAEASKDFHTGSWANFRKSSQRLLNLAGVKNGKITSAAELIEVANTALALIESEKLKPVSNVDMQNLQEQMPGLLNTPDGNKRIIEYMNKINESSREYVKAADKYYKQYGSLTGFESAWDDFVEQNPLFSKGPDVSPIKKTYSLERIAAAAARREAKRQAGMQ